MNTTQISAAKTSELVAFYNARCAAVGKAPVAKFADRKTAERRVAELVAAMPQPEPKSAAKKAADKSLRATLAAKATGAPNKGASGYVKGVCPHCGGTEDITCGTVVEVDGHQHIVNEHIATHHGCGHVFNYETGRKVTRANPNPSASKHIAASWKDPETFAARVTRNAVKVDGEEHSSVRVAFIKLGLPLGTHIKFRMALKSAGKLTDGAGRKWVVLA